MALLNNQGVITPVWKKTVFFGYAIFFFHGVMKQSEMMIWSTLDMFAISYSQSHLRPLLPIPVYFSCICGTRAFEVVIHRNNPIKPIWTVFKTCNVVPWYWLVQNRFPIYRWFDDDNPQYPWPFQEPIYWRYLPYAWPTERLRVYMIYPAIYMQFICVVFGSTVPQF